MIRTTEYGITELTDYDVSRIRMYGGVRNPIRNAFLLVCCTGIGYLDLREVTIGNIVGNELHIHPSLHGKVKVVQLTDEAKSYLSYKPLINISLPKLNDEIRSMMRRVGIYSEGITLYSARRYYRLRHPENNPQESKNP